MADDVIERAISTIREFANTSKIGDGKIFVFDIGQVIRCQRGQEDNGG